MSELPQAHGFEVIGRAPGCAIRRAPGYLGQNALGVLSHAIERRAFPGAAFAVLRRGEIVLQGAAGRFTYEDNSDDVTLSTVFDIASVSKVVATTSMAMLLYQRAQLELKTKVVELLPEFAGDDARRKLVTIEMLLAHSSGLPAYLKLFQQAQNRQELLRNLFKVSLEVDPGSRAEYSDIGFMILGELLQRIANESLDSFCAREVFAPLEMTSTCFCPAATLRRRIPPTRDDKDFRRRVIQGEVHDENASVMGGVSGHAGVFSNTSDLMKFASSLLSHDSRLFAPDTVGTFTARQTSPRGTSRALGWDTPSPPSQSGKHFSRHSFGHLGYTGTSLWIDAEQEIAIALLTNRTWPDNQSQLIKEVRPAFQDAVMEELVGVS
ncbi:MAG TPA: serine hydrolase [Terriglobales bacterium]|nr:serine hydrolase [Terriglobales bacterium]